MSTPWVILHDVCKAYVYKRIVFKDIAGYVLNRKRVTDEVLQGVSLRFEAGEVVGVVGLNSAGKTTLLKMIAGILLPTQGVVQTTGQTFYFSVLGHFYLTISLRENLIIYGLLAGYTMEAVLSLLTESPFFVPWITPYLEMPMFQCSSGVFVRATFLLFVLSRADILLIDEGPVFTDVCFQNLAIELLQEAKKKGKIVILATHNTSLIEEMCDRLLLVDDQKVVPIASLEEYRLKVHAKSM